MKSMKISLSKNFVKLITAGRSVKTVRPVFFARFFKLYFLINYLTRGCIESLKYQLQLLNIRHRSQD